MSSRSAVKKSATKERQAISEATMIIDNHLPVMITMVEGDNYDTEAIAKFYKDGLSQVRDFVDLEQEIKQVVEGRLEALQASLAPLEDKIVAEVNSSADPLDLQAFLQDLKQRDVNVVALKDDTGKVGKPPYKYNEVDLHFKLEMFRAKILCIEYELERRRNYAELKIYSFLVKKLGEKHVVARSMFRTSA